MPTIYIVKQCCLYLFENKMTIQTPQIISVASIVASPNLANMASQILRASGQPGMYGGRRVAAAIFNEMYGTVWTEDSPSSVEGQLAQIYVERLVKSNLPQPRENLSKDWGDIKKCGKKVASLLDELDRKKTGAKVKELYKQMKSMPLL
jgi:hypothetical protein